MGTCFSYIKISDNSKASNALTMAYRDPYGNVDYLLSTIGGYGTEFNPDKHFSRYCALSQPTMTGKTSLISASADRVYVLYLKFKTNAPPFSPSKVIDFLTNESLINTVYDAVVRFAAYFIVGIETLTGKIECAKRENREFTPKHWKALHYDLSSTPKDSVKKFWDNFYSKINEKQTELMQKKETTLHAAERFKGLVNGLEKKLRAAVKGTVTNKTTNYNILLLFGFDEASKMLLRERFCFRGCRFLCRFMPAWIFALLADTVASIGNFHPSKDSDPSLRINNSEMELFRPLLFFSSFDVLCRFDVLGIHKVNTLARFHVAIFCQGRAMWGAWMAKNINAEVFYNVNAFYV